MQAFREEGMLQEARQILRIALGGRFGTLANVVLAAIDVAHEATLEQIAVPAATNTLEQSREWLDLH